MQSERRNDPESREEIRIVVRETVRETLIALGLDAANPLEIQKDMMHLREWRVTTEQIKRHGLLTICGILIVGLIGLIFTKMKV